MNRGVPSSENSPSICSKAVARLRTLSCWISLRFAWSSMAARQSVRCGQTQRSRAWRFKVCCENMVDDS